MDLQISGRTALVVGGSKGVGLEVARQLRDEGCKVITVSRSQPCDISADLMEPGAVDAVADRVLEMGIPEIIYYCVGGSWGSFKSWDDGATGWREVWTFNLGIAVDLNSRLVPAMIERKWGRVVMTSTDGTKCHSGNPPYTSSKFAVEGYVETVSKQWSRHNVILTAVAPGHVYTDGRWMYSQPKAWTDEYFRHHAPIGRWAKPEEVARVVTFLCSEHASYMAGAIVRVDGGSR